jgi:HlyD family secretion protein
MKTRTLAPAQPVAHRSARPRQRKLRRLMPYAIVAGIAVAIVAGMWPKPVRVETAAVIRGPLTVSVFEEGKTRIRHRYMISAPVAGFLNRVELRPGARIQMGKTVLATVEAQLSGFLDARAMAEAEARVKAAEATKMQRQAELDRAKAALDLANKDFARADALRKTGAIATQEWDTTQNRVQMLTRELHAADFALHVADFEIAQAEAALKQAQHPDLEKSEPLRILAPVDGCV